MHFWKKNREVGFFKKSSLSRRGVGEFSFLSSNGIDFFKKMIFFKKREKNARTLQ